MRATKNKGRSGDGLFRVIYQRDSVERDSGSGLAPCVLTWRTARDPTPVSRPRYHPANYDVSPDGSRFLMIRSAGTLEYDVVYGFGAELRARVNSDRE